MSLYTFARDLDGHWYLITVDNKKRFDKLNIQAAVLAGKDSVSNKFYEVCEEINKFKRIDFPERYQFENPAEIK